MAANEFQEKTNFTKIAKLLAAIGPEALERYNNFKWVTEGENAEAKTKYDQVMAKLEKEFCVQNRTPIARFEFWSYERQE